MIDTKTRILDAAEKLVVTHGINVSLRTITSEAGVNLAAVNYHFQSKDSLWDAMIERRLTPLNAHRLRLLDEIEARLPEGLLPLETVLEAFLVPLLNMSEDEHFQPLVGRLFTLPEEVLRRMFQKHLQPVIVRFERALARAVPELPEEERRWRMAFSIGSMIFVLNFLRVMHGVAPGAQTPSSPELLKQAIITYTAGGFRSAATSRGLHV